MQTTQPIDAPRWYVLSAGARQQGCANRQASEPSPWSELRRRGFEFYAPQVREMVTPPRRKVAPAQRRHLHHLAVPRLRALFPGYMFIRYDAARSEWRRLFDLVGVRGLVCAGDRPYPVDDGVVARLRGLEVDGAIPGGSPVETIACAIGDTVRVESGPLAGHTGTIEALDGAGRISLLMSLFAAKCRVHVTAADIAKI